MDRAVFALPELWEAPGHAIRKDWRTGAGHGVAAGLWEKSGRTFFYQHYHSRSRVTAQYFSDEVPE